MKSTHIRISEEAHECLKAIAEKGMPRLEIMEIIDKIFLPILEAMNKTNGDIYNFAIYPVGKPENFMVQVRISPIWTGKFKFTENLSNKAQGFVERNLVEADILKKREKAKVHEK